MERRARLGQSDLEISRLVFGSMGRRPSPPDARARLLHAAIDQGMSSIDTAPLYDFGEVESFLGRALAGKRNQVELLSKVGLRWDDEHGEILFATEIAGQPRVVRRDGRPESIRRDVEASLSRLRTDRLDLCQIHHPDRTLPIEESLGALERLQEEGKIRHLGVSNVEPHELAAALDTIGAPQDGAGLAGLQLHYSLLARGPEDELLPRAQAAGVGILAYTPLEAGALTERMLDDAYVRGRAATDPLFRDPNRRRIQDALRNVLRPVAEAHEAPMSAVCLAWLLGRAPVSGVIVGVSTEEQLAQNLAAWAVALEPEQADRLSRAFESLPIDRHLGTPLGTRLRVRLGRWRRRFTRSLPGVRS